MVNYEQRTWLYSRKRIRLGQGVLIELLKYDVRAMRPIIEIIKTPSISGNHS